MQIPSQLFNNGNDVKAEVRNELRQELKKIVTENNFLDVIEILSVIADDISNEYLENDEDNNLQRKWQRLGVYLAIQTQLFNYSE